MAMNIYIPLQPIKSRLKRPKPAIKGLSCMLFPFFPRSPHLFARLSCSTRDGRTWCPFRPERLRPGVEGLDPSATEFEELVLPPRIAETDEWAHRACLRMADATVIHSVVIRATGSMATETETGKAPGRLLGEDGAWRTWFGISPVSSPVLA